MMKNKKRFFGPKGPLSIVRILPLVVLPVLGPLEKGSLPGESISTYFAVSVSDVFLDFLRNGLRILSFTFVHGTVSLPIGVLRYVLHVMPLGLRKKAYYRRVSLGGTPSLLAAAQRSVRGCIGAGCKRLGCGLRG